MSYVENIEPRLTPYRPAAPSVAADVLAEFLLDLEEELAARLELMTESDLCWQPHPDANSAAVTVWHVARWLDVLGTRAYTGAPARADLWHAGGWREVTGYEPDGIGFLGLGTLTGYTPEEMHAVPIMTAADLAIYLKQGAAALIGEVRRLGPALLGTGGRGLSPYQQIAGTVQGSFGHVGEIDTLVALRSRLSGQPLARMR